MKGPLLGYVLFKRDGYFNKITMIYRDIVFRYSRLVKVEGRVFSGIYNVATFEDTKISPSPWYETLQEMNATAREQILLSLKSEIETKYRTMGIFTCAQ